MNVCILPFEVTIFACNVFAHSRAIQSPRPACATGIAGSIVARVYLSIPVALNSGAGVPVEVAIPIGYLIAVTLQFNLQRRFVFRHIEEFELSRRGQIGRYVVMGLIQYPITAVATIVLAHVLGIPQRVTFVVVAIATALCVFLVLQTHVFHPNRGAANQVRHRFTTGG